MIIFTNEIEHWDCTDIKQAISVCSTREICEKTAKLFPLHRSIHLGKHRVDEFKDIIDDNILFYKAYVAYCGKIFEILQISPYDNVGENNFISNYSPDMWVFGVWGTSESNARKMAKELFEKRLAENPCDDNVPLITIVELYRKLKKEINNEAKI